MLIMKSILALSMMLLTSTLYAQQQKDKIVKDSSFVIEGKYMPVYTGTYKNGKAYDGYFKVEAPNSRITLIDYYEKGIAKYQYSKMLPDDESTLATDHHPVNVIATYKDGKIYDGPEYIEIGSGLTIKSWKQGQVTSFTVSMYNVNYFNRLLFEKKADRIHITNLEDDVSEINLIYKNKLLTSELVAKGKPVFHIEQLADGTQNLPPDSEVSGIKQGNKTIFTASRKIKLAIEPYHVYKINAKLLASLDLYQFDNVDDAFKQLADQFSKEEALYLVYKSGAAKPEIVLALSFFETNKAGKINKGLIWTSAKLPYYEQYGNGKVIKKETKSLKAFQLVLEAYARKLYGY